MREKRSGSRTRPAHAASIAILLFVAPYPPMRAQTAADTRQIIDRLERVERQNAELTEEIRQLRTQLSALQGAASLPAVVAAGAPSATEDALAIHQARIDEQAQSKVEGVHKLPLRISGMALFNGYYNTHSDTGLYAGIAASTGGPAKGGGGISQSIIGLEFESPVTVAGARVHGNIFADFFGSTTGGSANNGYGQWPMPRLRTGVLTMDWNSRSITVGVDKPLIAPYTPDSFAQVGVPPLSGAGNLWFWEPQARLEQRVTLSEKTTLRLQAALYSTHEAADYPSGEYAPAIASGRPGWEGRVEIAHRSGDETSFNLATGFHLSQTRVAAQTITSDLVSFDGKLRLNRCWNLTGTIFTGQDLAGIGGSGPGFSIFADRIALPVHSSGGWLQITLAPTERLSFHVFGGAQDNRRSDLWGDAIQSNASFAGNVYYQLAPNVFASFEAGRTRTDWTYTGARTRTFYDLSLAYLF